MRLKAVVHPVPEVDGGGYWAEVPALPGCMTQGDTLEEMERNLREAVAGWLAASGEPEPAPEDRVIELAV